jgi:hypothetical protein
MLSLLRDAGVSSVQDSARKKKRVSVWFPVVLADVIEAFHIPEKGRRKLLFVKYGSQSTLKQPQDSLVEICRCDFYVSCSRTFCPEFGFCKA